MTQLAAIITIYHQNYFNNNNNIQDNVYGAVIIAEFTGFIWWMWNNAKQPSTVGPHQLTWATSQPVSCEYTHSYSYITHSFTIPKRAEGWVDISTADHDGILSKLTPYSPQSGMLSLDHGEKAIYRLTEIPASDFTVLFIHAEQTNWYAQIVGNNRQQSEQATLLNGHINLQNKMTF